MPYPNEHAARIRDPGVFIPESFRSKDLKNGIRIIIGKLRGEDAMTVQTYRFSVDKFTVEEAKQWLKDHELSYLKFEPASESEVAHTGVLGMRWGVRRNRSGSGGGSHGIKSSSKPSEDHKLVSLLKKKKIHEMSNDELQKVATRIELERRYRSLNPTKVGIGKKAVSDSLKGMGAIVGAAGTITATVALGKKIYDYALTKGLAGG